MIPQFPRMVAAELRKILTRGVGQLGLVVALVVAVAPTVMLYLIRDAQGDMTINQNPLSQMLQFEVVTALTWSLTARNFFVLPLILLTVTAQLVAGEWSSRTLRSLVLRPVPRWSVLAAKFSAAWLYAGLTLAVTWAGTLLTALPLFTMDKPIAQVSLAFGATWLTDAGLITLAMLVSTLVQSVAGVIVGTILLLMADMALRLGLKGAGLFGVSWAEGVAAMLPGTALSAWEGHSAGWDPLAFGGLALLILICGAGAVVRFNAADVP